MMVTRSSFILVEHNVEPTGAPSAGPHDGTVLLALPGAAPGWGWSRPKITNYHFEGRSRR